VTAGWFSGAGWTIIGVVLGIGALAGIRVATRDPHVRKVRFGFFWERERDPDDASAETPTTPDEED
jgi:hypothetical protein